MHADIGSEAQVKRMFQRVLRDEGRLDILVNSAGVEKFDLSRNPLSADERQELAKKYHRCAP